jgi:N4-gp56 family major capsid protein
MPATLLADRPNEYEVYFSKIMLDHAIDEVHLADFAQLRPLPKNNGNNSVRFFRIPVASAANVQAVTEGTLVATSRKMIFEFVTITLSQFYDWIQISDLINDTEFNDTGEAASTQFGEECALWYDQHIRDLCADASNGLTKMYASSTQTFAGLGSSTSSNTLTIKQLMKAITQLRINKAPKVKNGPAKGSYAAVISPPGQADLFNDSLNGAFVQADAYNGGKNIRSGFIDNLYGIGFYLSTNPFVEKGGGTEGTYDASGTESNANPSGDKIYSVIVTGKDAFGASALQGNTPWSPQVMVNGKPDKYDVIGQFVNFSWKAYAGWAILNKNFAVNLRHKSNWAV